MARAVKIKVHPARCDSSWPGEYVGGAIQCVKSIGHAGRHESEHGTYWAAEPACNHVWAIGWSNRCIMCGYVMERGN